MRTPVTGLPTSHRSPPRPSARTCASALPSSATLHRRRVSGTRPAALLAARPRCLGSTWPGAIDSEGLRQSERRVIGVREVPAPVPPRRIRFLRGSALYALQRHTGDGYGGTREDYQPGQEHDCPQMSISPLPPQSPPPPSEAAVNTIAATSVCQQWQPDRRIDGLSTSAEFRQRRHGRRTLHVNRPTQPRFAGSRRIGAVEDEIVRGCGRSCLGTTGAGGADRKDPGRAELAR